MSQPADALESPEAIRAVIDRVRAEFGDAFIEGRVAAENEARSVLDARAGGMTVEEYDDLGSLFNRQIVQGKVKRNRFSPAFHGATMQRLTSRLDLLNEWTGRIWQGIEEEALEAAGQLISDRQLLPGSGRTYPSMLLYLRDPTRFAVWGNATEKGLRQLTNYPGGRRVDGLAAYLDFSERCRALQAEYELAPQEVDAVLSAAAYRARQRVSSGGLLPDTFAFLNDLRANSGGAWMEVNRQRYQQSLRDPFKQLLEVVASNHVGQLDPLIQTDVKLGKVMAAIRKRFPDAAGEYYDYFWGAFSRHKKQQDVQLAAIVRPEGFRFGLYLGSAEPEQREALLAAIDTNGQQLLEGLLPHLEELTFSSDDRGTAAEAHVEVTSVDQLRVWAEAPRAFLFREVGPDDPVAFSPDLAELVGKTFEVVYPLAAAGWGVALPGEGATEGEDEEDLSDAYTLEQLAADTFLPEEILLEWAGLLSGKKRQALFYGPPGSGKTHIAEALGRYLAQTGETLTVQFHPSYSYEDFIEGLRPTTEDGQMRFEVRDGTFLQFCDRARRNLDATFVLIVDEVNRADLGSTLGELMLLLEYRGKVVELPYSQKRFSVPGNVIVLGTMNTADRSLALVDFALRRRFHAIYVPPTRSVLTGWLSDSDDESDLTVRFYDLVQSRMTNRDFAPGHSYWMVDDRSPEGLLRVWQYELKPYLQEFWFEHPEQLRQLEDQVTELLAEGDEGDLAP